MTTNVQNKERFHIDEHFAKLMNSVGLDPAGTAVRSRSWAKIPSWRAASDSVHRTRFPTWGRRRRREDTVI